MVVLAERRTQCDATQPGQSLLGQHHIDCVVLHESQGIKCLCGLTHHLPVVEMRHERMDPGDNQGLCMHNQELYLDHDSLLCVHKRNPWRVVMLPDGAGEQIEAERIGALASIDRMNMPSLGGRRVNGVH
jgi:hypothetical protein